jgi:hypothetical protein
MVEIHGENPNVDYMLKFDSIIGDKPIITSKSDKPFSTEQLVEMHDKHLADKVYKHEELHELFVEETMPKKDFKFIGTDGCLYLFNVNKFNHYLEEERRDTCIEMISTVNGNINWMQELGLAKPFPFKP